MLSLFLLTVLALHRMQWTYPLGSICTLWVRTPINFGDRIRLVHLHDQHAHPLHQIRQIRNFPVFHHNGILYTCWQTGQPAPPPP